MWSKGHDTALYIAQTAVLLDEKGEYQTALPAFVVPAAYCLASAALGAYIASEVDENLAFELVVFGTTFGVPILAAVESVAFAYNSVPLEKTLSAKLLTSKFGIVGFCGSFFASLVFISKPPSWLPWLR